VARCVGAAGTTKPAVVGVLKSVMLSSKQCKVCRSLEQSVNCFVKTVRDVLTLQWWVWRSKGPT